MCSILFTYNMLPEQVNLMIKSLALRGRDGYGIMGINTLTGNCKTLKDTVSPDTKEFLPLRYNMIIANSRAVPSVEFETGAGFDEENLQPFENKDFVVVMNGVISNDNEIREEFNIKTKSKVDTAILPELFSKLGVVEGLRKLEGGFAIICYDKINHKLFVAKNFLPLRYYFNDKQLVFCSLKESTDLLTQEVLPYTIWEIDLNNIDIGVWKEHSLYKKERNKKVLVICSGGADSVTTAYLYKHLGYEVNLLHFKYGQAAEYAEEYYIKKLAEQEKWKLIVYDAKQIFSPFKETSKLFTQTEANPEEKLLDAESTKLSYVPNRNMIFSSIGASYAEMLGCDTLAYGGNQEDGGVYPDNAIPYLMKVDETLKYSLNWFTNIRFTAPLINIIKHETVGIGKKLGIDYNEVASCYYPQIIDGKVKRCHKCGCCVYLDNALKMCEQGDKIGNVDEFINKYVKTWV